MSQATFLKLPDPPGDDSRDYPRRATMRPSSQNPQHSISCAAKTDFHRGRRAGAATLLITLLILCGPPAFAGVETHADQGRRTQTGPKEVQIAVNGFPIGDRSPSPTPSGYTFSERGRLLHARPTQSVLVGLIGCPGCDWGLEYIDGLYLGIGGRRIIERNHPHRARTPHIRNADHRLHHNYKGTNDHD